jgi:transposase
VTHYVGLDVSLRETAICIVDSNRNVIKEGKAPSEAAEIADFLQATGLDLALVGLEAGPLAPALYDGLIAAGLPAVCIDARHMKAASSAMSVKTDRIDARQIAWAMQAGWYRAVHVKRRAALRMRMLLSSRGMLVAMRMKIDNHVRGVLKGFGLKVGKVSAERFPARVRELVVGDGPIAAIAEVMLATRAAVIAQLDILHRTVLGIVKGDPICRRLMTVPGVGPITSLAFKSAVDVPERFRSSEALGAYFGLTPRKYASGETDRNGRITKCGDRQVRALLCEAANVLMTRVARWSSLKRWALEVAKRRGQVRARVALARRLAVILHRMWLDETDFRWGAPASAVAVATS